MNQNNIFIGLSQDSIKGLETATREGLISPVNWKGKLKSVSGDITHLTDWELEMISKHLNRNKKDIDIDNIKILKNESCKLSDDYSKKVRQAGGWKLNITSTKKGSSRLRLELAHIGILEPSPSQYQAHHIVPTNQGELAPILEKYGIMIDSASNGVFLPVKADIDWPGQVTHSVYADKMFRHGNYYIDYLKQRLNLIEDLPTTDDEKRDHILSLLSETRTYLLTGELDFLYEDKVSVFKR